MYGNNNLYPQNYPNFSNYPNNQQNTSQNERIWVSNQQSAESYLVAPNGFARLWDSSRPVFYEKRADATGRPLPMDVYEYTRINPQISDLNSNVQNVSMDEINARFEEINSRIDTLEKAKKVVKNAKQSDTDDSGI